MFSPGDIVGLHESDRYNNNGSNGSIEGIVYRVTNDELVIAFNQMHDTVSHDTVLLSLLCWLNYEIDNKSS